MMYVYECFRVRVHLPLCPYVVGILNIFDMCPFQVNPNDFRVVLGLNLVYGKFKYDPAYPHRISLFLQHKTNPLKPEFYFFSTWLEISGVKSLKGNLNKT